MSFEDKSIVCVDCGQSFTHSAEDQARYAERGFTNEPKRCRTCREKRKAQTSRGGGGAGRPPRSSSGGGMGGPSRSFSSRGAPAARQSYEAVCAECGATTTVPFQPKQGRPVYCRDCFRAHKQ